MAVTTSQAVSDVINSVASEENGISNLLAAEAAKINAVTNMPGATLQQILAVNASAQGMFNSINRLETVLQNKLETLSCEVTA